MSCNAANRDRSLEPMSDSSDNDDTLDNGTSTESSIPGTLDVSTNYEKLNLSKRAATQRRPPSSMYPKDIKFEEIEFEQLRESKAETNTSPNSSTKAMPLMGMTGPRMGMGMGMSLSPSDLKSVLNKRTSPVNIQSNIPKVDKEPEPIRFQLKPTKTRNTLIDDKSGGNVSGVRSPDMEIEGRKNTVTGTFSPTGVKLRNTNGNTEVKHDKDINDDKPKLEKSVTPDFLHERKTTYCGTSSAPSYKLRSTVIEKKPIDSSVKEDKPIQPMAKLRSSYIPTDVKKEPVFNKTILTKQSGGNIDKNNSSTPFPVVLRKTDNSSNRKTDLADSSKSGQKDNLPTHSQKTEEEEPPKFLFKLRKTGQREALQAASPVPAETPHTNKIILRDVNKEPIATLIEPSNRPKLNKFQQPDTQSKASSKLNERLSCFEKYKEETKPSISNLDSTRNKDGQNSLSVKKISEEISSSRESSKISHSRQGSALDGIKGSKINETRSTSPFINLNTSREETTNSSAVKEVAKNENRFDDKNLYPSRIRTSSSANTTQVTTPISEDKKSLRKQKSQSLCSSSQGCLSENPLFKNNPFLKNNSSEGISKAQNSTKPRPLKSVGNPEEIHNIRNRFECPIRPGDSYIKPIVSSKSSNTSPPMFSKTNVFFSQSASPKCEIGDDEPFESGTVLNAEPDSQEVEKVLKKENNVPTSDTTVDDPISLKQRIDVKDGNTEPLPLDIENKTEEISNPTRDDDKSDQNHEKESFTSADKKDENDHSNLAKVDSKLTSKIEQESDNKSNESKEPESIIDCKSTSKIDDDPITESKETQINIALNCESSHTETTNHDSCGSKSSSKDECIPSSTFAKTPDPNLDKKDESFQDDKLVSIHPEQQQAMT